MYVTAYLSTSKIVCFDTNLYLLLSYFCLHLRSLKNLVFILCVGQVACGFAYTAVVTQVGALYTWGAGENGRLGLGDELDRMLPCQVDSLMDHKVKGTVTYSMSLR